MLTLSRPLRSLATGMLLAGAACRAPDGLWVVRETFAMGTRLEIQARVPDRMTGIAVIEAAFGGIRQIEDRLSTWRPGSEMTALNEAAPGTWVQLSAGVFSALQEAVTWARRTEGAFDPAVGSLVDAWDLRGPGRRPDPQTLARAREAAGIRQLELRTTDRSVRRRRAGTWVDAGGFGKGIALRTIAGILDSAGVHDALINLGGQVLAMGRGPDGAEWTIDVAHPADRVRRAATLRVSDVSVATSSQSERRVPLDSGLAGHVLDPRTGEPVPAWGSVTVVDTDPMTADILATALLVMGPTRGGAWARQHPQVAALFLEQAGDSVVVTNTPAMAAYLAQEE